MHATGCRLTICISFSVQALIWSTRFRLSAHVCDVLSCVLYSPWYNGTGWLGVKHQVTYLLCYRLLSVVVQADQMRCYLNSSKIADDSAVLGKICPPLTSPPTGRKISLTLLVIMLQKREAVGQKPMGGVCTGITEYVTVSTRVGV